MVSVRVSARARRVRLVMHQCRGLEVVVPRGFDPDRVPAILEEKRDWIDRAWRRVDEHQRRLETEPPHLPQRIVLPALGREWEVEYRSGAAGVSARESGKRLIVTGSAHDPEAARAALRRWLTRKARAELVPWLTRLGDGHGLRFKRVTVRQQKSRWGSCSRLKTISLNARLLFLPPTLVEYVLLHELCHLSHLDHSPRFWGALERHAPEWRERRRELRDADRWVPTWLDHQVLPSPSDRGRLVGVDGG